MWSLDSYLIARDCGLRLTLTGTLSTTSPVVCSLRGGLITGELRDAPAHPVSMHDALTRILNTQRKADTVIPTGTRVYWGEDGQLSPDGELRVTIDFGCVTGDSACFYFVSRKRMGGTPPVWNAYIMIAESIKRIYPDVRRVYVRELLLSHLQMSERNTKHMYDILTAPPVEVEYTEAELDAALKDIFNLMTIKSRSDRRKCRVGADPCPAYDICPVINEK
ncbi:MAG: hypothetical protein WC279_13260 [Sulfurimonas sp.]|jgi:hypothetical protein|uniref:hypothetical protein n=1 Tax=Sulfurimonas sp. TaxID=2022749 RepID=UPI003569DEDD